MMPFYIEHFRLLTGFEEHLIRVLLLIVWTEIVF